MGRVMYPTTHPVLVKVLAQLLHSPPIISTCMMYLMVTMPMLAAPTTPEHEPNVPAGHQAPQHP